MKERVLDYEDTFAAFVAAACPDNAAPMKRYMRDQFEFLGIKTPVRRALERPLIKAARHSPRVDWEFVEVCWGKSEREFQYLAVDYLRATGGRLTPADLPRLRSLAERKSWWDSIDGLCPVVGLIAQRHPEARETVLAWSRDENFWIRRMAIDHQLTMRERTDTELLAQVIINNLGLPEFFINKAIGWALRDYSKTNPGFVRSFIETHGGTMAPLSIREASKYL
ncbi:MAG: DNA alkylation repair protein [Bifidobacteriaceae bacterium]|jgi:3-methyladenine DNA glycosylase AlkD|nr:DNA alkylation repair protein [Bifidobacteriaceae bacterium]